MRLSLNVLALIAHMAVVAAVGGTAATAHAADGAVGERYKPVFEVTLAADSGELVAAYLKASGSPNAQTAIERWEQFLREYGDRDSIEDITDLTLVRQAHYELMRLYYQAGRVREGDRLLRKADDFVVYSLPEPAKGKQWCRAKKYCE